MLLSVAAIIAGLALLVWSADRFVEGAAAAAGHLGMPPLLIGMVVVGFGTSAPEMVVSAISSAQGNPGIALGNALGSNITNIALILGITAVISPIVVHSKVIRKELPLLCAATLVSAYLIWDGEITGADSAVMIAVFAVVIGWTVFQGLYRRDDALDTEMADELAVHAMPLGRALMWLAVGLVVLVGSSRALVWGAVHVATAFGVGDLVIGLTVVAVGTSLPELASSVMAARKGEHDIALGNVIGSNIFNTLAVVGIAGAIHPMEVSADVMGRDLPVMGALTVALFVMCFGFRRGAGGLGGRINRAEGAVLIACYAAYTVFLVSTVM